MTRKVTVNLYATLDGRGAFPKYPGSDVSTGEPDAMFQSFWIDRYKSVDTVVMGRRSWQGHRDVHSEANRKPTDPKYLFEYSRYLDRVDKVVLSRTLRTTDWQNSRLLKGDLRRIIAKLKGEPGKDIIVEGGPALVRDTINRGLVDDYWIVMQPVIYGRGPQYWGPMKAQQTLKLLSVQRMPYGEFLLHYEAVR